MEIRLPIRSYRIDQWMGSGMPSYGNEGYHTQEFAAPVEHIGIVSVHCWNYGDEDGNYPIEVKVRDPYRAKGWIDTAQHIMTNFIKPTFEAARKAGVRIFHAASTEEYAVKYDSFLKLRDDPDMTPTPADPEGSVRPFTFEERMNAFAGPGYKSLIERTYDPDRRWIAKAAAPVGDEEVFMTTYQLNDLCRRYDIDTIFYVGFTTKGCIIHSPGAMRDMSTKLGYRCILLRECTTSQECEDTCDGRQITRMAIRWIESNIGFTASSGDFVAALERAQKVTPVREAGFPGVTEEYPTT